MQAGATAAFGDVDVLNFGVSTPKLSHSHHIEALGPCRRPPRFTSADETGCQAELELCWSI